MESRQYAQLREAEKQIDLLVSRKRGEVMDALVKGTSLKTRT